MKVPLIFWFIMIFYLCFISNYGLNGYGYILEIVLGIDKLIHASRNICGCLTLNEIHIKLTSLIIYFINDNLINMSSTPPPKGKKTVFYIAHLIILSTSKETSIYQKFKDKIFNLFEAPNQHNCCVPVLWKFLQVLISVLGKWSI